MPRITTVFDETGKIIPGRLTTANLRYSRNDLAKNKIFELLFEVFNAKISGNPIYEGYFLNALCAAYANIPKETFSLFFRRFSLKVIEIISCPLFQNGLKELFLKREYYSPKATWIVERKEIRNQIRAIFDDIFIKDAFQEALLNELRKSIKYSLVHGLEFTLLKTDNLIPDGRLHRIFFLNQLEDKMPKTKKLRLAMCPILPEDFLEKVFSVMKAIPSPPVQGGTKDGERILRQFKDSMIEYMVRNAEAIVAERASKDAYLSTLKSISDIFNHEEIHLYLSEYCNAYQIIGRIFTCMSKNKMLLTTMTCPDYSGSYENDSSGQKWWVFDFETLNEGEGVVAKKAYPYIMALYSIFKKYIAEISIRHDLPTMEFPIASGFQNGKILKEETTEILKKSLEKIKRRYKDDFGIEITAGLSDDVISDECFEMKRQELVPILKERYTTDQKFHQFVHAVFKKRKSMYQKWYPQSEGQDSEEYKEYIMNRIFSQLADYCNDVIAYTSYDDCVFMTYSDSPVLTGIYYFANAPALSGQGKYAIGYKE